MTQCIRFDDAFLRSFLFHTVILTAPKQLVVCFAASLAAFNEL